MSDLAAFLLARIADEEDVIRSAQGTPPRTGWQLWTNLKSTTPGGEELGPRGSIEMSPERALAECEAKRRIVDELATARNGLASEVDNNYRDGGREHMEGEVEALERVARLLAEPYSDHPDFPAGPEGKQE